MNITYRLLPHQKRFLQSKKKYTVLSCGRSAGKSYIASLLAAMELIRGKRILVWAQSYKALTENLMHEIVARLYEMGVKFNYNQGAQKITFGKKGVIYGLSYENIETCRGFTEIEIAVCDEVALAPANFFGTMTFCMRGEGIHPRIYAMTTPRMDSWWNVFVKNAGDDVEVIHATMMDNKFLEQDTYDLIKATCIDENMLRQEMYGELVEGDGAGIMFSPDLLRRAAMAPVTNSKAFQIGVDCSGLGTDRNCIVVRRQNKIERIVQKVVASSSEMCSIIHGLVLEFGRDNISCVYIDEAYNNGLDERLRGEDIPCCLVPFGGAADDKVYLNKRAEMYFTLRNQIDEFGMVGITDELASELRATKYILNNSNRLQLIPKADIKTNIGKSPDIADALALTCAGPIIAKGIIRERNFRQSRFMQ